MKLEIKQSEDPILRQPTEEVVFFDMELEKTIDDMVETMRNARGIGLAAPQVGISKKIFTIEFEGDKDENVPAIPLTVLCNPRIVKSSTKQTNMVEGCLSFPGVELIVKRPKKVTASGFDRYGNPIEIEADGLFARVLQHETDHLNSILLVDHMRQIDLVFIGTGSLGVPSLELLSKNLQYKIKMVITGDSSSISRNGKSINLIEESAKKLGLPILKTDNINSPEVIEQISKLKPEIGVMADFGQIISEKIIEIPKHGIINIHPSLLPKHRGPSPIQQTILDGDKLTGISLIKVAQKMDAGDLISQVKVRLEMTETATILKQYLAKLGAELLLNSLPFYIIGDLKPLPQNDRKATYSHLFKKEDGLVDAKTPATEVDRKIRAFCQWPKVYFLVKDKRVQLIAAHFSKTKELVVDLVKPESKKEMTYDEFCRGYKTKIEFAEERE